jgi:transcriptional regulator with XRE-family HTH domain
MQHRRSHQSGEQQRFFPLFDLKLDFALAIEHALSKSGKKRADLARELGVSPSRITAILRGEENLTMEVMHKLAVAVGHKISIGISPARADERREDFSTS